EDIRESLRDAFWGRARALNRLGRAADALRDCDRALELETGKERDGLRALHAHTLALLGERASALAEADEVAGAKDLDGLAFVDLAATYALSAAAVARDDQLKSAERAERHERQASRAVELLPKARAQGYQGIEALGKDGDFTALRSRADFQKLLQ